MTGYLTVIKGLQYGDEGKGKIVDWYSTHIRDPDIVARFQGGNNAGHTIVVEGRKYKLHYLPGGVVRGKLCVLGNGLVIDPLALIEEANKLKDTKWNLSKLRISERAHVTLPHHIVADGLDHILQGKLGAGSTLRGIAPTYADKTARIGIRFCDLLEEDTLEKRLNVLFAYKERIFKTSSEDDFIRIAINLTGRYGEERAKELCEDSTNFNAKEITKKYHAIGKQLSKNITNTSELLQEKYNSGASIIAEGAQGDGLDLDHGIFPYGTSSNTVAANACIGLGIPMEMINEVIGVVKALSSRVGSGPLPSEIEEELVEKLRVKSDEYGTTTGRPRRLYWLDLVQLKNFIKVNKPSMLALTKLDILGGEDHKICDYYTLNGKVIRYYMPASIKKLAECKPHYMFAPKWPSMKPEEWIELAKKGFSALPETLQNYVKCISDETGIKKIIISVGQDREATTLAKF